MPRIDYSYLVEPLQKLGTSDDIYCSWMRYPILRMIKNELFYSEG